VTKPLFCLDVLLLHLVPNMEGIIMFSPSLNVTQYNPNFENG